MSQRAITRQERPKRTDPDALVYIDQDRPLTTSRRVADRFNRRHDNVLRSIRAVVEWLPPSFVALNFEAIEYVDESGRSQPEYLLTMDGFMALGVSFTGSAAAPLKSSFIDAFWKMRQELQRRSQQRGAQEWKEVRASVARNHRAVNEVLTRTREMRGKSTETHHLWNEARLIGYAVTGTFAGLDRDTLDAEQLRVLQRVEAEDVILISQGVEFEQRKSALRDFVLRLQAEANAADAAGQLQLPFSPDH